MDNDEDNDAQRIFSLFPLLQLRIDWVVVLVVVIVVVSAVVVDEFVLQLEFRMSKNQLHWSVDARNESLPVLKQFDHQFTVVFVALSRNGSMWTWLRQHASDWSWPRQKNDTNAFTDLRWPMSGDTPTRTIADVWPTIGESMCGDENVNRLACANF